MSKKIQLSEIFGPTIQGEGALIGLPTIFVRTAGCDYRCDWCDTLYAVDTIHADQWYKATAAEIMTEVERLSNNTPLVVTLSGGNPAMPDLEELLDLGHAKGYRFAMETQGSLARPWFAKIDYLTLSPKGPSSLMKTDWQKLKECRNFAGENTQTSLKVVVFDETDYDYARQAALALPDVPVYLQPGNHRPNAEDAADIEGVLDRLKWLAEKVAQDEWYEAKVLPQLHVLIWGNERGV
ncbi:7-carboxy-7-deazaguanine synthase QueE [Terasakiella pusilla]|uniref:7-carboxy-7-deazaguanine synthase QueE n=1 Tax=Terasakiella pusilla TaxID=64973 RepID=UPI00048BE180|nr:7-carboxy-7-deazaguanine synthase QueE [Terasakiella pusilla]